MLSEIVLSGYLLYLLTVVFSFCSAVVVAAAFFQKKKVNRLVALCLVVGWGSSALCS